MKLRSMKIVLEEIDKNGIVVGKSTICERDETFKWTITGPLYPRHLNFLNTINELARELDAGIE